MQEIAIMSSLCHHNYDFYGIIIMQQCSEYNHTQCIVTMFINYIIVDTRVHDVTLSSY